MDKALKSAERKARLRDSENEKVLTQEELELANELQAKTIFGKMKLVPEKKVKNKAKFAQIIQPNWGYLFEIDYLKTKEYKFLNKVIPYIGFLITGVVLSEHRSFYTHLGVSDLNSSGQMLTGMYKLNAEDIIRLIFYSTSDGFISNQTFLDEQTHTMVVLCP